MLATASLAGHTSATVTHNNIYDQMEGILNFQT